MSGKAHFKDDGTKVEQSHEGLENIFGFLVMVSYHGYIQGGTQRNLELFFFDVKGTVHLEFVPLDQMVNQSFFWSFEKFAP